MEEILQYIKTKHPVSSGIIYCLSRLVVNAHEFTISHILYHILSVIPVVLYIGFGTSSLPR